MNQEEQFIEICKTLENSDPEKLELFKILCEKYDNIELDSIQVINLNLIKNEFLQRVLLNLIINST